MQVNLIRVRETDRETYGVLEVANRPRFITLELPYRDNERMISSIPEGSYTCAQVQSPRFGNTFEVQNVLGRDDILFHWGNTWADTLGCILVGTSFAAQPGTIGIQNSKIAFEKFRSLLITEKQFELTVSKIYKRTE